MRVRVCVVVGGCFPLGIEPVRGRAIARRVSSTAPDRRRGGRLWWWRWSGGGYGGGGCGGGGGGGGGGVRGGGVCLCAPDQLPQGVL